MNITTPQLLNATVKKKLDTYVPEKAFFKKFAFRQDS